MDLRAKLVQAFSGAFNGHEDLWLFPADPESEDGRPKRLSAVGHPSGWESWPEELKQQHLQLMQDRDSAVALITQKNRLLWKSDELHVRLNKATDATERQHLQDQLDALVDPLRNAKVAVEEAKEAMKLKDRALRLAFLSHRTFQITDISTLTSEQTELIERQLDELEPEVVRGQGNESG